MKYSIEKQKGYTILELLFYIALFSVLSMLVINAMLTMAGSLKEITLDEQLTQSGNIMERMSREIRGAIDINSISASDLNLKTADNRNPEFKLSGTNLQLLENGAFSGNLNAPNILITNLAFTSITTAKGKAVKIVLTVRPAGSASIAAQNFYDTIVLRGDY